jgi:RimJ/RimL family protein N-acetyltransferase/8-oxo-dGTP pyrophosphatase MutT (NUDIX family)
VDRVSDEQPVLDDGDLRLRPWTPDDVEITRLLHDAEIAHWFDVDTAPPSSEHHLSWVERTRAEWSDSRVKATFLVEWRGAPVGSVDVRRRSDGVGVLSWVTYAPYRGRGLAARAVRLLVDWAFTDLGLRRVEAEVNALNRASLRTALRAGLRREGLLRGNTTLGGEVHDTVVLGRLADDPAPGSREGFTAMLDSVLPTKRVIGQGLVRAPDGAVLLCEPVYKRDWDLPGGVVDPGEPPRVCVAREIREELALYVTVGRLLATNWLAPWLGWGDALLFVYEVEMPSAEAMSRVRLLEREIRAVHWVAPQELGGRVAPYNERMLTSLASAGEGHATLELADGIPVR